MTAALSIRCRGHTPHPLNTPASNLFPEANVTGVL